MKIYKNLPVGLIPILQMYKNYKRLIRKKRLLPYSKSKLGLESNFGQKFCQLITRISLCSMKKLNLTELKLDYLKSGFMCKTERYK